MERTDAASAPQGLSGDARLRLAEAAGRLGFWELDYPGREMRYSEGYRALLGFSQAEFPDRPESARDRLHPEDAERVRRGLHQAIEAGAVECEAEFRLRHRDGRFLWQRARVVLQRDREGRLIRLTGVNVDVTEAREQAERIAHLHQELEQFCFIASHDLQEPLRMISSYMQLLSRRYRADLVPEAQQFIDFAVGGSKRMSRLLHDLLIFSRLSRSFEPRPVDCQAVVEQVIESQQIAITEAGAQCEASALPTVAGDSAQLALLFRHLLQNALTFRRAEAPRIEFRAERRDHEWLFRVRDNGIGIEPSDLERIFLIFQRGQRRADTHSTLPTGGGSGLGLAACKRVVENHRGRMWVESQPGVGSTFLFTLPA